MSVDVMTVVLIAVACLVGMFGAHVQIVSTIDVCRTYEKRISSMCWIGLFDLIMWSCSIWMIRSGGGMISVGLFSYLTAKYMYFVTINIKRTMQENP